MKNISLSDKEWHHLPTDEIIHLLTSDRKKGLVKEEAERRFHRFGANVLTAKQGQNVWIRFLMQFHQPLIYILIAAGVVTAALQEWVDSGVIFGVILVNAIIGFIQESKAESALAALANTMVAEATVLRNGEKKRIPSTELVPGDIVLLQAGDKVPADLRLLTIRNLQVDESALTGESIPVEKRVEKLAQDTALAERINMAYASSMVTYGQGIGIVTATGDHTEVGRISRLISSAQDLATPLTRKIAHFSHILLYAILLLAAITVAVGLLWGQSLFDMFMAAVALAVGAIPEGLPAAVTITLAIGVSRMAKRRAIIRKLPAVETLGSTTVICSDKTGTLTENQMTVQAIIAGDVHYEVSGVGYAPFGQIVRQEGAEDKYSTALNECLRAGILCNDSLLLEKDNNWQVQGDPTEGALFVSAAKNGFNRKETVTQNPRLDSIPFESQHQYMATLHDTGTDRPRTVYIKGAVEQIVAKCAVAMDEDGNTKTLQSDTIHREVSRMAARGLRVLAFACVRLPARTMTIDHADVASGLTFLGLQGMIDPPRAEVVVAVKTCRKAGIKIKMITGDHPITAAAIAGQIGISTDTIDKTGKGIVLTGAMLEKLSDDELTMAAEETNVFARATPEQKIRLVRALQTNGHVVAMTGDGVNDAPALKQANIGVAMGITGTDVSKEAADMVLTDDNFSSIEAAVEEGRGVFDNLTKFIVWTLPTNLGEGLVILTAIFLGITLPILPVQILWINMTTAGFLGLMLAFEPKEPGIMQRQPRHPDIPILTRELITRIFLVGTLLLIGAFGLFELELAKGASLEQARTVAVNTFVIMELFYLFNCRSLTKSIFQLGVFTNMWVFGGVSVMLFIQLIYTYLPTMNRLFHSAPIGAGSWAQIGVAGLAAYVIVEVEKKLRNNR
ncbi:P-type ATPase, translocating [Desulfocapsa sulfexigens DSM 10523]|uniref:P-type ATPase, translocating n=1 Tax=Desulfocapsa sulfexigens (strain DSM 10523 / SB164P1) TaxID=1167006 RepID=M1NJ53_DESSD|nr:cation-transporting P-type ATPase [Desulfocapsa sulfexigens]AGF79574.1 P-type ATPase, translocating [Desulfocapsa sulfexigens DSM 10523]